MALHWTCVRSALFKMDPIYIDELPGHFNDRRSPLGELNWIFTAITDTIAWLTLPPTLFRRLYRQDALVASLMRNFLLAERILKVCGCTPTTIPALPPMHQHTLWNAWDVAVDFYLAQIPNFIRTGEPFLSNPFFVDQLTAFEIWLEFAKEGKIPEQLPIVLQVLLSKQHRQHALKLLARFLDLGSWAINLALSVGTFPYVLKLLQSPAPELREDLVFIWSKIIVVDKECQMDLCKERAEYYFAPFLTTPKLPIIQKIQATFIISSMINNFPMAQNSCYEIQLLKIIQQCLISPQYKYLKTKKRSTKQKNLTPNDNNSSSSQFTTQTSTTLFSQQQNNNDSNNNDNNNNNTTSNNDNNGNHFNYFTLQHDNSSSVTMNSNESLYLLIKKKNDEIALFKQWLILCAAKFWEDYPEAKLLAYEFKFNELLQSFLTDQSPLVRTAAVYAIGTLLCGPNDTDASIQSHELQLLKSLAVVTADMTPIARKELLFSIIRIILLYEEQFNEIVLTLTKEKIATSINSKQQPLKKSPVRQNEFPSSFTDDKMIFMRIWHIFLSLRVDPHPDCSAIAHRFFNAYFTKLSVLPEVIDEPVLQNFLHRLLAETTGIKRTKSRHSSVSAPNTIIKRSHSLQNVVSQNVSNSNISPTTPQHSGTSSTANNHPIVTPLSPPVHFPTSENQQLSNNHFDTILSQEMFPSQFYKYSAQYFSRNFSEILPENDETSPITLEKHWRIRQQRNYFEQTLEDKDVASRSKFENQIALFNDNSIDAPSLLQLHPSEPICVFSDNRSNISCWNWRDSFRLSLFHNLSSFSISALQLVNTQERFHVISGSSDGIIRVWGNVDSSPKLLTSWRAFSDDPSRPVGNRALVFDWNETGEYLVIFFFSTFGVYNYSFHFTFSLLQEFLLLFVFGILKKDYLFKIFLLLIILLLLL